MVYRIYVEKKPGFDVEANGLKNELTSLLGIKDLTGLRPVSYTHLDVYKRQQVCCAPADLIRAARAATAKIIF